MATQNVTNTQGEITPSYLEAVERALQGQVNVTLFLDRYGVECPISLTNHKDEEDSLRLTEARYSPSFEICCVLDGILMSPDGTPIEIESIPFFIKQAEAERIRFYTEREQSFGASAWPGGSRPVEEDKTTEAEDWAAKLKQCEQSNPNWAEDGSWDRIWNEMLEESTREIAFNDGSTINMDNLETN